jgi:hypothetical protein
MLFRKLYELQYHFFWAFFQAKIDDYLLNQFWLVWIFVIIDDVVLEDLVWKFPVTETTSHDERLQLIQENIFQLVILEEKEDVIE